MQTHSQQHIANRIWISNGMAAQRRGYVVWNRWMESQFADVIKSVEHGLESINKSERNDCVSHVWFAPIYLSFNSCSNDVGKVK